MSINTDKEQARIDGMLKELERTGSLTLKDCMFFLPDDCKRFEGKGSWVLHVKEGKIIRREAKEEKK